MSQQFINIASTGKSVSFLGYSFCERAPICVCLGAWGGFRGGAPFNHFKPRLQVFKSAFRESCAFRYLSAVMLERFQGGG